VSGDTKNMASETEERIDSGGRGKRRTEERAIHEDGGHGGRVVLDRIAIVGVGRGRVVVKNGPGTRSLDMAVVGEDT